MSSITEKEKAIAILLTQGMTHDETAKVMKLSRSTISRLMKKEGFLEAIEHHRGVISERREEQLKAAEIDIDQAVLDAKKVIFELALNAEKESTQLAAAKFIVERYDIKPKEVQPQQQDKSSALKQILANRKKKERV